MPRRNYDRMYKEKDVDAVPAEEPKVEESATEEVKPKAKKVKLPFMGTVTGGLGLNVRKTPGGQIIGVISDGAQIRVLNDENPDWYQIESPAGYVMKKFIKKA